MLFYQPSKNSENKKKYYKIKCKRCNTEYNTYEVYGHIFTPIRCENKSCNGNVFYDKKNKKLVCESCKKNIYVKCYNCNNIINKKYIKVMKAISYVDQSSKINFEL